MKTDFQKLLVEETPDALMATSPDGKVLHWNRGAEATFGYSGEEAVGRSMNFFDLLNPRCCSMKSRRVLHEKKRT